VCNEDKDDIDENDEQHFGVKCKGSDDLVTLTSYVRVILKE
jgi:hypothetical protein